MFYLFCQLQPLFSASLSQEVSWISVSNKQHTIFGKFSTIWGITYWRTIGRYFIGILMQNRQMTIWENIIATPVWPTEVFATRIHASGLCPWLKAWVWFQRLSLLQDAWLDWTRLEGFFLPTARRACWTLLEEHQHTSYLSFLLHWQDFLIPIFYTQKLRKTPKNYNK